MPDGATHFTPSPRSNKHSPHHRPRAASGASDGIVLTVVVPVKNEADNILPLIGEIRAALAGGPAYEILYIDDGSTDATRDRLERPRRATPELRRALPRRQLRPERGAAHRRDAAPRRVIATWTATARTTRPTCRGWWPPSSTRPRPPTSA